MQRLRVVLDCIYLAAPSSVHGAAAEISGFFLFFCIVSNRGFFDFCFSASPHHPRFKEPGRLLLPTCAPRLSASS